MVKFLLGLVTGVILVFLTFILLFIALVRMREKPPEISDNSVLVMRLSGDVPEKPPLELPLFSSDRNAITVANVWMALRKAAADPHIKAVVVEPDGLDIGWGKMEEFRGDLEQFRKSGKPLVAYLRMPGTREYYVSLAADRIYLGPQEPLYLKGVRAEIPYLKKGLDKLGVVVEVEHAGKYKDFGDMFTRSDMSPETREVTGSIVDDLYGTLVDRIAAARKKTPDEVRALIDQGPFTATGALQAGLVDELRFEDQMFGELRARLKGGEPNKVSLEKYVKVPAEAAGLGGRNRVALVVAQGDIVRGSAENDGSEDGELTSYGFDKMLRQAASDSTVKGLLVRIDSPGGDANASDEMWREMNLAAKKKPLVISMGDVAASGGYYMAMTGDTIVAYPETETGSIGVVFGKPVIRGLLDKLGINFDGLQRGRNANIESLDTPLTPEQRDLLRRGIDESYRDFVTKVANARHRPYNEIEPLAQGRVWLGSQAKARGLVDELGGIDAALAVLKKKAGIPAAENVSLVPFPPRRTILDLLLKRSQDDSMVEAKLRPVFGRIPYHAWLAGGMLRIMPYWIEVK
ncbi:MAG TPA: signal peptide peptidase SppA [Bryobacteraceae bacterium]|nr:signal peptide peptidase SppA [Bryobacteraceae bacterium]